MDQQRSYCISPWISLKDISCIPRVNECSLTTLLLQPNAAERTGKLLWWELYNPIYTFALVMSTSGVDWLLVTGQLHNYDAGVQNHSFIYSFTTQVVASGQGKLYYHAVYLSVIVSYFTSCKKKSTYHSLNINLSIKQHFLVSSTSLCDVTMVTGGPAKTCIHIVCNGRGCPRGYSRKQV